MSIDETDRAGSAEAHTQGAGEPDPYLTIHELEKALRTAITERDSEYSLVSVELTELQRIYERLRADMRAMEAERDQALDAARLERENRARERLEMAERLEEAIQREDGSRKVDGAALRERFVAERLAAVPTERLKLPDNALPEIPGFEMLARIGRGGMASVFHAKRLSDGAEFAVKLLQDGGQSGRVRTELFLREAAVMLQLDHPSLVGAIDAGECAYGRWLAMEYVAGESLAARLRREGTIPEKEAIGIAIQIGRTLAYCARLGLTHRDVKPANVLLPPSGGVKLCDFGLAALIDPEDPARSYGSPGYAAPEQLATPTDVDHRADIYGLGCTLWQMLVGCRPFAGPAKEAFAEAKTTDLPDPRAEGAKASQRVVQVLRRMGRADRTKRYARWDECLIDLMLVERGNPPFAAHLADVREKTSEVITIEPEPVVEPITDTVSRPVEAAAASRAHEPGDSRTVDPQELADLSTASDHASSAASRTTEAHRHPAPAISRLATTFIGIGALAVGLSLAVPSMMRPDPFDEMRELARELAANGRAADAARCLRAAAAIAPDEAVDGLLREAERIESE